ncbi:uncharacterized protein DDB_G0287625-like [Rhagoletis pomonella]|uniref:uncharacterized protein DDB_G0287625-like n=1 Tax=Rhagoletis pomonella TaxID=28610 RepID=UPI00177C314D|nr:uncharacterized protein DDB_G0287625-like [Rhagoletis pomonella]
MSAKKLNKYKYALITACNNILLLVIGKLAHTCNLKEEQDLTDSESEEEFSDAKSEASAQLGKNASLQVINNNYTEFAKRVEELSDAFERSLIIEGMTQSKAHEMAVEQTVNVCRLNTRSDLVKSILSSTTFSDSKDVVAKMIVEQNNQVKERQVLAFRSRVNRPNSFRSSFKGHNFNRYTNNGNNSRYNNNGARHNGNNFNNNSNRSSNNSNRNNNSNINSNRRPNSRNNNNVRTLNAHAPQERTLRAEEWDN